MILPERAGSFVVERRHFAGAKRRGMFLFATIVALLAAGVITMGILRSAMSQYGQIRDQRRQLQAEQLAQAGIGRALNRLRTAGDYQGETWRVSAKEIGGPLPAEVVIHVAAAEDATDKSKLRISVQADYPNDDIYRSRQSRELLVTLQPKEKAP